jgi:UDP-N-acetylmuramoylalanine--D-glutamate ligase
VERAPNRPDRTLFLASDLRLTGVHNLENAMAAVLLAMAAGGDPGAFPSVLREFKGLRHRMERVAEIDGVVFINDSKGTNPAASSRSLSGFPAGSVHLILGGRGKGLGFEDLANVAARHAARVYLVGETAEELERVLRGRVEMERPGELEPAVRRAAELARPGETVLLSPACASFDQYASFGERGDHFVSLVKKLGGQRG